MIDLHNHILPGVDDGPADLAVALRMLEIAAQQGITHVACTPHANDSLNEKQDRLFQSVFQIVKIAAKEHRLPLELTLASELMVGSHLLRTLAQPTATFGGQGKYCLIEFPTETPYEIIQNVVISVRRKEIWPVLAHFERFSRAQKDSDQPRSLRKAGAILTLDAGSLTGQFGNVVMKRAKRLLSWGVVDMLASDAHDAADHGFRMSEGYQAAIALVGAERAQKMVLDHPRRVWEGQPWMVDNPTGAKTQA